MGFFSKNKENETINDMMQDALIEVNPSLGLNKINANVADKIVALNSCVNLISNSIASLPIYLYKRDSKGERVKVNDNRNSLLNLNPSGFTTAFNFKNSLIKNFLYSGNAYIYITRDNKMNITGLDVIESNKITVNKVKYTDGSIDYNYKFELNGDKIVASSYDMINIIRDAKDSDTPKGVSVLEQGARILNISKSSDEFLYSNLNGVNSRLYLKTENKLSPNSKANLKESFRRLFSGSGSALNGIPVLEDGLELMQLNGFSVADLELLQSVEFTNKQICLLLNIPFTYVTDSASSYNNSEQETLRFLQTLTPYTRIIEEYFNIYLLTEKEKADGYFFEFKVSELLKLSPSEKVEYLSKAISDSLMTVAEARKELNLEPIEGTDILILSNLGIVKDGQIVNVNMGKTIEENNN